MSISYMEISDTRLWTIDYDALDSFSAPSRKHTIPKRPQKETYAIEVVTDRDERGVAAIRGGGRHACDIIDAYFTDIIEGSTPFDIEWIWDQMSKALPVTGQGALGHMAMSGVDLALWDLMGNITGQPVYNLLGGLVQEEIPCYVTIYQEVMDDLTDKEFLGYKFSVDTDPTDGLIGLNRVEKMIAGARENFGDDVELMLDPFMAWDKEFTVRAADRLHSYDVKWIEDPLPADHTVHQYRDIRKQVKPIQIAVGNNEFGHKSFHQLINHGAADIVQPDIQWIGGMTEMNRIGAIAKPHDIPVIPHRSNVYSCHYAIARTNSPYIEYMLGTGSEVRPLRPEMEGEPLPEDGRISISDDAGFGITLNRDILKTFESRHPS